MMVRIKPIKNDADLTAAMKEFARLWNAEEGTPESDQLDILAILIEKYESEHFPMRMPDPIEAILYRMEQAGLSRKDLEPMIGSRARVSEVLNRKRPLSLEMIRQLNKKLNIPAEVLIS